jgi:electron-transferring-flavoprotein dehydrogenase
MIRPADYPPPYLARDFVVEPSDPADEGIEAGFLIVGAGPAGLSCAIRLCQLVEGDPETAEQLGEAPIVVLEKGRQPGSHLLSGAVVNPGSLKTLLGHRLEKLPTYGRVDDEAVFILTSRRAIRIPTPPTMRNHGNVLMSLSEVGRWLTEQAEELGAMVLSETAAERLLVSDGCVVGVRTGDKGRLPDGGRMPNFEPGTDITARVTVLAEGTQGHLTGVAIDRFQLHGDEPQVWELGVKEVWKVARPLEKVIHTLGWPLRPQARYREFGGSFIYPMGPDMLSIGLVVGLDYRDVELSPHDLLQELKTHPMIRSLLDGGERVEWGAKTIPGGGFHALPRQFHAPGVLLCGDGAGMVNIPTLKGVHYAVESGRLAAEAAFAAVKAPSAGAAGTELSSYDDAIRSSSVSRDLHEVRDVRSAFGRGLAAGTPLAGAMVLTRGRITAGRMATKPDASQPLLRTDRATRYPAPDGVVTFDKLSSVFAASNRTRDDQPNHILIRPRVPREVADLWVNLCPAKVYSAGTVGDDGLVTLEMEPSNCVQCGAITAKGGRLTPPEGGSGPEYRRT